MPKLSDNQIGDRLPGLVQLPVGRVRLKRRQHGVDLSIGVGIEQPVRTIAKQIVLIIEIEPLGKSGRQRRALVESLKSIKLI